MVLSYAHPQALSNFTIMNILRLISLLIAALLSTSVFAEEKLKVAITKEAPSITVLHQGSEVKVKRIQDTENRLVDDFSKTSRPCPPFCIHPMEAAPNVETIGELELLEFVNTTVKSGNGLLIDARMPKFFNSETIPGSINIPFILFTGENAEKVIKLLGVKDGETGLDFSQAKELSLYCNGPWCDQSPRAIQALIKVGYPASKLKYYRGGMQLWKIFSLTTVLPKPNQSSQDGKK